MSHFRLTDAQADTVGKLVKLDYKITYFHADGVIDMCRDINGERVRIFVPASGHPRPPRTDATSIASAELIEAGLTVKAAKDSEGKLDVPAKVLDNVQGEHIVITTMDEMLVAEYHDNDSDVVNFALS